jgi:hypothetical protein
MLTTYQRVVFVIAGLRNERQAVRVELHVRVNFLGLTDIFSGFNMGGTRILLVVESSHIEEA